MVRIGRVMLFAAGLLGLFAGGCSHGTSSGGVSPAVSSSTTSSPGTSSNESLGGPWSGYEQAANYANQHGTVVYQVTYQPNAVVFDEGQTEQALKDISPDGVTYTLDAGSPIAAKLKAGSVLFLYGIAIRKVTAVQTRGANLLVSTTDGDITDAIRQGHISWQVPMDFSVGAEPELPTPDHALLEDLFATRAAADESLFSELGKLSFEGSVGPVEWELLFAPAGDRVNIEMDAKMANCCGAWEAKGEGYVQTVTDIGEIDINNGQIANMGAAVSGMQGHMDFEWQAQTKSPGVASLNQSFKVKIPGASIEVPLIIGPLPFVFEVSAALIVHPAFTAKNEITSGKFTVDYNGKEGFKYTAGAPESEGSVEGTDTIDHSTSIFGATAMGLVAALELPRFEIAFATMSPSNMGLASGFSASNAAARERYGFGQSLANTGAPGSSSFAPVAYKLKNLAHFIEEVAIPVKPYFYFDFVTSTGTFTNGVMTSSLVGMEPCQRAQITVSANVGVGAKLTLAHGLSMLPGVLGKTASFETFEAAKPIMKKSVTKYKNGLKCPGD